MFDLHEPHEPLPDCDCGECAKHERDRLRSALLDVARRVEALKRPCGMDPETPQAIRNGEYMSIALIARAALMGPNAKVSGAGTASAGLPGWQANSKTE